MSVSLWYPSVEDVLAIHDDIVSEYPDTPSGVWSQGDIEFALQYIEDGTLGAATESIHGKAFHLVRLLVANHPFVDANKRTALNTAVVFYLLNGYRFEYNTEIRVILKQFGTDETSVDEAETIEYFRTHAQQIDLKGELAEWRDELVQYGLNRLSDDVTDPND